MTAERVALLETENLHLRADVALLRGTVRVSATVKSIICTVIAATPSSCWSLMSRIVRAIWWGFRDA